MWTPRNARSSEAGSSEVVIMIEIFGALPASGIATARTPGRAAELSGEYGMQATAGCNRESAAQSDLIVLAVKPGTLPKVVAEFRDALNDQKILLSLAASVPIALIEKLAGKRMPIFRAMPNIPVVVEEGATAVAATSAFSANAR